MPSLWYVMPAHGRVDLARICMRQLRRTCDQLEHEGIRASAVVIADDENLDTARDNGFATVPRDNRSLGRKFNDGIQLAVDRNLNPRPADYVVPIGSDDGAAQVGCAWSVSEFTGVDTSGSNGAGAIVQSVEATAAGTPGTTGLVNLAALEAATSACFGCFGHLANETNTVGSGFTLLDTNNGAGPANSFASEWKLNDTSVDMTWATSSLWAGIAAEIREPAAGFQPRHPVADIGGMAVLAKKVGRVFVPRLWTPEPVGDLSVA